MPLIKKNSKKDQHQDSQANEALPEKKSIAIAYNMAKKKPKFAKGGSIDKSDEQKRAERAENDPRDHRDAGTTNAFSPKGKLTPVGKMVRKESLEEYKKAPKPKLLAEGGEIDEDQYKTKRTAEQGMKHMDDMSTESEEHPENRDPMFYADGGDVEDDEKPHSVASAIMKKRSKEHEEPMIDLDNKEGDSEGLEHDNEEAADKPIYDDSQFKAGPEDGDQHGDEIISDMHDMISKIRSKLKSKRES